MSKKTVWIVNEYTFPGIVGTRQSNLCRLLNERGYDAFIISGSSGYKGQNNRTKNGEKIGYVETEEAKGYYITTSNYKRSIERVLVAIQFQHRIWRMRNKIPKPDVIVSDFAGLFGNVFLKWKKKYGTKIIFDILDLWPEGFVDMGYLKKESIITKFLYKLEHRAYREADGLIFSMQGGRDYIKDKGWDKDSGGDVDTTDIGYLNNGVDFQKVMQQKNTYIFDDPDLDSDLFKVIYLGSISPFNGLDILVETAKVLKEQNENRIKILIYGHGTEEEKLKNKVSDYGLSNIVFKGRVDKKYAMSLLTKADINIFTFANTNLLKYGVSPNKLFMYFSSGKPVLSMIKPAYDLVEEHKAGFSVENDPVVVAEAIKRFSNMNKEEYDLYCRNARQTAELYDYKNLVQVLIDKIEGIK